MKKKNIILVVITLVLLLSSCTGIKEYDISVCDTEDDLYIIDTTQKKYIMSKGGSTYHLPTCYIVKNIKKENIREFYGKQFFIERDIAPCKRCEP